MSRFLSPDPYIQSPWHTQSYNRYAYVFNNPLSFIDPSGLTANSSNTIEIIDPIQIRQFWNWLMANWENNQDQEGNSSGGGSWSGGGPSIDGIWDYIASNGLGGVPLPEFTVVGTGVPGSYQPLGGVPKWWGDHPARYPGGGQDHFNLFNTMISTTISMIAGERGLENAIRNLERLQSESRALARKIGQKGPWGNYPASINRLKGLQGLFGWLGRTAVGFGVANSYFHYTQGNIGVERLGLEATVAGFTAIPVAGQLIGLNYLLIDQTIGIDNVPDYITNHALERSRLINQGAYPGPGLGRSWR